MPSDRILPIRFARRNPHGIALRLGRVCLLLGVAAGHVLVALTIGGAR